MKKIVFGFAMLICLVLLYSLGSAWYAAFILGGQLWLSTPYQILLQMSPYLLGLFVIFSIGFGAFKYSFNKTK